MAVCMDKRVKKNDMLFPKRLKMYNEIYIGHTPTLAYGVSTPMQAINLWNLDTGGAFTGALSIMDIDSKKIWQSDIVKTLYPHETGRNKA
jgi:serine/threonine protein phosphatase 1